ncbi:MAG: TrmH family RNA methyltransferase, partial [Planctomycetota bacterium]
MSNLDQISIVLVRPAGDLNIGAVARAMMNTGFRKLVLVGSRDFQTPDALRMAVSAKVIVEQAKSH